MSELIIIVSFSALLLLHGYLIHRGYSAKFKAMKAELEMQRKYLSAVVMTLDNLSTPKNSPARQSSRTMWGEG